MYLKYIYIYLYLYIYIYIFTFIFILFSKFIYSLIFMSPIYLFIGNVRYILYNGWQFMIKGKTLIWLMRSMKSWKVNNILDCITKNQAYVSKTFNKEILY